MRSLRPSHFVIAIWLGCAATAAAQAPFNPPRTPDGQPDLQGTWSSHWMTPIERLPEAETVVLDAAEAARVQSAALDRMLAAGIAGYSAKATRFSSCRANTAPQ